MTRALSLLPLVVGCAGSAASVLEPAVEASSDDALDPPSHPEAAGPERFDCFAIRVVDDRLGAGDGCGYLGFDDQDEEPRLVYEDWRPGSLPDAFDDLEEPRWVERYSYDANGFLARRTEEREGSIVSEVLYTNDDRGNPLSTRWDNDGDGIVDWAIFETYDDNDLVLVRIYDIDGDGTPDGSHVTERAPDGRPLTAGRVGDDGYELRTRWSYDGDGRLIEQVNFLDPDDESQTIRTTVAWSEDDPLQNLTTVVDAQGEIAYTAEIVVDEAGLTVRAIEDRLGDGTIDADREYAYDEAGRPLLETHDEVTRYREIDRQYDERGRRTLYASRREADGRNVDWFVETTTFGGSCP